MQRIRLDGVDFAVRPPPPDDLGGCTEQKSAEQRHGDRQQRIKCQTCRKALAGLQMKKDYVQQIDQVAHRRHHQAGDGADQCRERDKARFPCSNEGAEAPRYFESVGHFSNQDAPAIVSRAPIA